MRSLLVLVLTFLLGTQSVLAQVQSNDFRIRLAGVSDTEPPTTPTLLSAIPVAATQIDVSWTAATDNTSVAGYVLSRDGMPIATTSLLTYADTGLTASTTYSYTVQALDLSFNYSSSSNSIATTTPATPVPPAPNTSGGSGAGGTNARVVVEDLFIEVGISTTSFSLTSELSSRLEVRWGRTASYELGYVLGNVFAREHFILLTDLEPGTTYEYEIVGYTPSGAETVIRQGTFVTASGQQLLPPVNVSRFVAVAQGDDVSLSWELPEQESVAYVRIVRSHLGFPESPQSGAVIYQGLGLSASDRGILSQYSPAYYTAFVYDDLGTVSSGAVAVVFATNGTEESGQIPITNGSSTLPTEATSTIVTDRLTVDMKMPELGDLIISQRGESFVFSEPDITLDAASRFVISIPKSAVSGNLKSIIASITDPVDTEKQYSYLLRINKDRTAYEAQVSALKVDGGAVITIAIHDFEAFVVGTYQVPVTFVTIATAKKPAVLFPDILFLYWPPVLFGFGLLILFLIILLLTKRLVINRPAGDEV